MKQQSSVFAGGRGSRPRVHAELWRWLSVLVVGAAALLQFVGAEAALTSPLPTLVEPRQYRLQLRILPEQERFSGTAEIDVKLQEAARTIRLHGRGLRVTNAYARAGRDRRIPARYREVHESGVVELSFDSALAPGDATLVFEYDAPFASVFRGLVRLKRNEEAYAIGRMYPINARSVFPCFDEPRFKTPFTFVVTSRQDDAIITSTPAVATELLEGGLKRVTFATSKPLATYLLALSVGPFDQRDWQPIAPSAQRDHVVPLRASAGKGKGNELAYALDITAGLLTEYERYLGIAYPFSKLEMLAIPRDVRGALSNAAAIAYGEPILLRDVRAPVMQRRHLDYVHSHELAHQWFGNLVTPSWWHDRWMNESFAEWLAFRTLVSWAPGLDYQRQLLRNALDAMDRDSRVDSRAMYQRIATTDDIDAGLTDLIYAKGAAVIRMFENEVGPDAFQRGVRRFLKSFPHGTAGTDDLLRALEQGAATPGLEAGFRSFLNQPGVPLVELDWQCERGALSIRYSQSRHVPLGAQFDNQGRWALPLCLSYSQGSERRKHCQRIERPTGTFRVPVATCPERVMPNASGAGYYRFSMSEGRMRALVDNIDELEVSEALSLEDSLAVSMEAGRIDAAAYLAAVPRFASHPAWDVAVAPLPRLTFIMRNLLDGPKRDEAKASVREMYRPILRRVGLSSRSILDGFTLDEAAQLRNLLVPFLALEADDAELREQLASIGVAYVGLVQKQKVPDEEVIEPVLIETAVTVAAQRHDRAFADHLWKKLGAPDLSADPLVGALARQNDPALAIELRERAMSSSLPDKYLAALLFTQANVPAHRDAFWRWARQSLQVLRSRLPDEMPAMIAAAGAFCSRESAREISALFAPIARESVNGQQVLQATLEKIERCAALSERQSGSAREFFRMSAVAASGPSA